MGLGQGIEGTEEKAGMFSRCWYCLDGLVEQLSVFDRGFKFEPFSYECFCVFVNVFLMSVFLTSVLMPQ